MPLLHGIALLAVFSGFSSENGVAEHIDRLRYTISFLIEFNLIHIYSSYRYFNDSIKAISVQGESNERFIVK